MQITTLLEEKGGNRFGTCVECGMIPENGNNKEKFKRIRFEKHISVCLCPTCYETLMEKMAEK